MFKNIRKFIRAYFVRKRRRTIGTINRRNVTRGKVRTVTRTRRVSRRTYFTSIWESIIEQKKNEPTFVGHSCVDVSQIQCTSSVIRQTLKNYRICRIIEYRLRPFMDLNFSKKVSL